MRCIPSRLRMARGASGFFGDALALASTSATRLLAPSPRGCADSYTPPRVAAGTGRLDPTKPLSLHLRSVSAAASALGYALERIRFGRGSGSSRRFPNEASRSLRRSTGSVGAMYLPGAVFFKCVLSTMADAYPARPGRCAPRRRRTRPPLVYRVPRTRDLLAHPRLPIGTGEAGDPDGSFKPPREQLATAKTQKSHRQKSSLS